MRGRGCRAPWLGRRRGRRPAAAGRAGRHRLGARGRGGAGVRAAVFATWGSPVVTLRRGRGCTVAGAVGAMEPSSPASAPEGLEMTWRSTGDRRREPQVRWPGAAVVPPSASPLADWRRGLRLRRLPARPRAGSSCSAAARSARSSRRCSTCSRSSCGERDRVVTKEELLDTVWGDRFVSESALTSRIKAARQAIGDDGKAQRLVRTVHGRGLPVRRRRDRESTSTAAPSLSADPLARAGDPVLHGRRRHPPRLRHHGRRDRRW